MKMALTDGMVRIIEADAIQKTIIKSWNQMRWIRGQQMYEGIASAELLERMYPEDADIVKEFHYMESQIKVSVPVEELFRSLGERCGIEDMENFAAVFYTAKRTGGDMSGIIQTSARMLGDKIDVKKEIETTLAAKKAEQMVMSLMPAGIILYLKLTSPGFLGVLYGNPFGIAAMTLCLGIYGFSYWLGRKIVDIEV